MIIILSITSFTSLLTVTGIEQMGTGLNNDIQ